MLPRRGSTTRSSLRGFRSLCEYIWSEQSETKSANSSLYVPTSTRNGARNSPARIRKPGSIESDDLVAEIDIEDTEEARMNHFSGYGQQSGLKAAVCSILM